MPTSVVSVRSLTKRYGALTAVNKISFDVQRQEIFALIGPNGAGKSTTLRILATVLSPTSGTVTIGGFDLQKDPAHVRAIISYLPEEAGAYKNLTGQGYLQFMAQLYAHSRQEQREFLTFAQQICALGNRLNDKLNTYSKGMTRKLLLARAVMTKPQLAILDEPTSGLDIINAMEIRSIVKGLSQHGMSVVLSSHNMLEIEFLSDRVGIIDQGKLLTIGTPAVLKARAKAHNLEEVFLKVTK